MSWEEVFILFFNCPSRPIFFDVLARNIWAKTRSKAAIDISLVYVGNIVIARADQEEIMRLKDYLARKFEIRDLGQFGYFLGIEPLRWLVWRLSH